MRARALAWLGLAGALAGPLGAQTHPGGRWWTLETAHFRVHVRPSQRDLGARAAGEAEAAFAALAAELPPPRARIDLVVTDHLDEANGSASLYPTPVIVINAVPPAGEIELGTYDRWLRLVITHELAHIFDLDLARGWWRVARAVFGRAPGLFPNDYAPSWRVEGLAVYYESRLTEGGRLRGSFHGDVVAAAAERRHGLAIDAAGGLSPRWPGGIRPYAFGSRFLSWMAAERGDSVVPRLVRAGAGQLLPYVSLNGTLGRAAGISLTAAWRAWEDSLRAAGPPAPADGPSGRCAPLDARRPAERLCGLRLAVQPRVAPDGTRLLMAIADGRDAVRLGVFDPRTGELRRIARLNGEAKVAWDGDGGAVVSQLDFTDPYTIRGDLWRVGLDGRAERLTRGARLGDLDVAATGDIVAVRHVPGGNELVRRSPDGRVTTLVAAAPGIEWADPRFAPGGRSLAAVRVRDGWRDIVLLSPEGEVTSEVTADPVMDRDPAYSPDGGWLFWSRDIDGVPQIVGLALDTAAAPGVFTHAPFGAYGPAVTRDSLYYLSYRSDGYRLEAVARDGAGAPLGVTTTPRPDAPPPPVTTVTAEHTYHPWPSVLPHFWSPVGEQQVGGVGFAGAFTAGGDALGRHRYAADFSFGTGGASGTWRGSLFYVYAGLTPALLDLSYSRDQLRYYLVANPNVLLCCIADESATAALTVRHRRWRTAYAARLGAEYDRTGTAEYRGVVLSAAAAHTVEPALSISTQDGWRLSATLRRKDRIGTSSGHTEHYVRLAAFTSFAGGGFSRHVLAARAAVGVITGNDNVGYGVGGISGGSVELLPGVTFGSGSRNFPVRGYAPASEVARQVGSFSLELRSPLALVGRGYGLWPAMLDRVSLAVFTDLGGTRAAANCPQTAGGGGASECVKVIGSVGAELVTDLGVAYDFPVRLRFGAARRFTGGGAAYVAVGAGF